MAKRKRKNQTASEQSSPKRKEPKFTHLGFQASLWSAVVGLVAQLIMAVLVYPRLPDRVQSGWFGSSTPYTTSPSWLVFVIFPGAQIVMILIMLFARRNDQGKQVMETGNAVMLVLLSVLFTALQLSTFRIPHQ